MENASKALLMAGAVLIGIVIISIAVFIFNAFGEMSNEYENSKRMNDIAMFNDRFEKFDDRNDLRFHDIITVLNLVKEYKYEVARDIKVTSDGIQINDGVKDTTDQLNQTLENNNTLENEPRYNCKIEYDESRIIQSIEFKKI